MGDKVSEKNERARAVVGFEATVEINGGFIYKVMVIGIY